RGTPQAGRILLHRLAEVAGDEVVVVTEREVSFGSIGSGRGGTLSRGERGRRITRCGSPVVIDDRMRARELGPGGDEAGVQRHGLLVVAHRSLLTSASPNL